MLVLRILSEKYKKLISKIPGWHLDLSHGNISRTVNLWATLINSLRIEGGWRLVFALALIAFLIKSFQLFFFLFNCFIWVLTKGLSLSLNNQMRVALARALSASNLMKMDWKYLRWKAQSSTSFWYWEFCLILLQIIFTNAWESPILSIKENFKFVLHDQDRVIYILFPFVILLAEANLVSKERHSKKNSVKVFGFNGGKVTSTLVTKVKTFHIRFTTIYVRRLGLLKLISKFFRGGWGLSFKNRLSKFSSVYLEIEGLVRERFGPKRKTGRSDNSLSDLKEGEGSRRAIEGCFLWWQPRL